MPRTLIVKLEGLRNSKKGGICMLAEERFAAILSILQKQKSVTVLELTQKLSISESTIRRDLVTLHKMGKLKKVHGGATLLHKEYGLYETESVLKSDISLDEKKRIGEYAASLIQEHDFVYIDAGSTTLCMIEYIREKEAVYVTNGLEHANHLAAQGFRTYLLAGELKGNADSVAGLGAISSLQKYNFNKAFLGMEGITINSGFTTNDVDTAYVKMEVMKHTHAKYILADSSKFDICMPISVANICEATIITGKKVDKKFLEETDIIEIEETMA